LLANTKQSIARQFPMLDKQVMAHVSAEIWWLTYELLHWNLHDNQWAMESYML